MLISYKGTYNYYESPSHGTTETYRKIATLSSKQQLFIFKLAGITGLPLIAFERGLDDLLLLLESIPKEVDSSVSIFEDAFGNVSRIDIGIISDWDVCPLRPTPSRATCQPD